MRSGFLGPTSPWRLVGRRRVDAGGQDEDGYAAVDALVALTMLATTIVLSIAATHAGLRAAAAALEARQSTLLMKDLIARGETGPSTVQAKDDRYAWRLVVGAPTATSIATCAQTAEVTALRTGRRYRLATSKICLPEATSHGAAP